MPDTAAVPAPASDAGAEPSKQEGGNDILEIIMEGATEPLKIPRSKIPMDKLQPDLAKFRAEADRKLSEVDRRGKELDARAAKYDTVEKLAAAVQKDPAILFKLAQELGMTEEQLESLSKSQIESRIKAQLRDEEETAEPEKKRIRMIQEENERLKAEAEELRKQGQAGVKQQIEGTLIQALEEIPGRTLKLEAAREMVPILRELIREGKSISPKQLAEAAREALRRRASFVGDEDETYEFSPKQLERAKAILAKQAAAPPPPHPAAAQGAAAPPPKPKPKPNQSSSRFMLDILSGKR